MERKNWPGGHLGVIGELVALRALNTIADVAVCHHPIDFQRSVDEVDLAVSTSDGLLRLETKAHLLEAGKSWFMVNERARDRSNLRGAAGYMPVLSVLGANRALVGRLISSDQLEAWGVPDKPLKDPAVAIRLVDLASRYFDTGIAQVEKAVGGGTSASRAELTRVAADAGRDLARWREQLPPLEDLPAHDVVEAIQVLL